MRHASRRAKIILVSILTLLLVVGGGLWYLWQSRPAVTLPQDVVSKTLFPIYVPAKLPSKFYLNQKTISQQDGVLLFQLTDGDGRLIALTEQSTPANFDFAAFYEKQIKNARTLSDTPYHSVLGETVVDGIKMLSIRADDTWVMVSGQRVGDAELEFIAKNLRKL